MIVAERKTIPEMVEILKRQRRYWSLAVAPASRFVWPEENERSVSFLRRCVLLPEYKD